VDPADGTKAVAPSGVVTVMASGGTLSGVTLTADDGSVLPGALATGGTTWRATAAPKFGTAVKMAAHLYGLDMGSGFGKVDLTTDFAIGRSQIVKADARSHHIQVVR